MKLLIYLNQLKDNLYIAKSINYKYSQLGQIFKTISAEKIFNTENMPELKDKVLNITHLVETNAVILEINDTIGNIILECYSTLIDMIEFEDITGVFIGKYHCDHIKCMANDEIIGDKE